MCRCVLFFRGWVISSNSYYPLPALDGLHKIFAFLGFLHEKYFLSCDKFDWPRMVTEKHLLFVNCKLRVLISFKK